MVGTKNAECNVYKKQSTKDKGLRFLLLFYSAWTQHFAFQECHSYQPTTRLYKAIPSMPCQCQSIERVVSPYLNCLLSSYNSEVLDCYRPKVTQVRCNTIAVPFFFPCGFVWFDWAQCRYKNGLREKTRDIKVSRHSTHAQSVGDRGSGCDTNVR